MENFNDRKKNLFNNADIPAIKVCSRNVGMDQGTFGRMVVAGMKILNI